MIDFHQFLEKTDCSFRTVEILIFFLNSTPYFGQPCTSSEDTARCVCVCVCVPVTF